MKLNANCSKSDENNEFKVVLLGVSGVGKTSLITRYVDERFTEKVKSTIGMAFVSKAICVGGKSIRLHSKLIECIYSSDSMLINHLSHTIV